MTVVVFGAIKFSVDALPAIAPHLRALVEQTRQSDGCFCYDVSVDFFDPGLIRFSEVWPDQASLDAHFNSNHVAAWRKAISPYAPNDRAFVSYDVRNPKHS